MVVFHLLQLHRHAGCGMMGHDGAMAALSHPSSFCHQTHNEWRPRQLNHHRHNVGYDHDDYDVSPYDHHDLRYTGGVLLLCGWGLWPAAGVRCCTCLPLLHARLHLSMMHLLLGDWAPPSWPWPRSSVCKCVWREGRGEAGGHVPRHHDPYIMQSSKCITNKQLKNGSHSDSPSLSHFCPLPLCLHLSRMA